MKIDLYSNMFNEELILPYWLRHYNAIADRIFIWDDESTDRTKEILSKNPKVTFLEMGQHGDDDGYWTQQMFPRYEQYSPGNADWVIVADADEFIYHPRLMEILEEERKRGTQVIQCTGYTMIAESFPTSNKQLYEEVKMGLPDGLESKWTIHMAEPGIRFARGRHGPIHAHRNFVCNRHTGIKLFHYRYFGEEYYANRDKVTLERNELVFHHGKQYSRQNVNTLPDGTRGVALDWFALHKGEVKNVVDEGWGE